MKEVIKEKILWAYKYIKEALEYAPEEELCTDEENEIFAEMQNLKECIENNL